MSQRVVIDNAIIKTVLSLLSLKTTPTTAGAWRVGVDSLRALVEAIVLSDELAVDELDRAWAYAGQGGAAADLLKDIAKGISIEVTRRESLQSGALQVIGNWFPAVGDLQQYLEATPCDETFWWELARDREESGSMYEQLSELYDQALGYADSPLYCVGFAAYRVAFYHLLCTQTDSDYWPHPLRTGLLAPLLQENPQPKSIHKYAIEEVEKTRASKALQVNLKLGGTYDVAIPVLLAFVLKRCTYKEDILEQALIIRDTNFAKSFRQWVEKVNTVLRDRSEGILPSTAIDEVDALCKDLQTIAPEQLRKRLGIGLSIPWGVSISASVKLPYRAHLVFLSRIYDGSWGGGAVDARLQELLGVQ